MRKNIVIFLVVLLIGTVLGIIGTISFPIWSNMSYFWPAAVIQSLSGLFFGMWGVIAATLFPSISNTLTDGSFGHIVGLIPANFIQSYIPFLVKKMTKMKVYEFTAKNILIYILGCAIVPHLIGGFVGCLTLFAKGELVNIDAFLTTYKTWLIGNIPCSIIFGLLLLRTVGPVLKDCELCCEEITV